MNNETKKGKLVPELRFPGFDGEWEVKILGEIADRCNFRNKDKAETRVLTNSATEGVVDQNAYFDKDIAIKENTDNYHIVDRDDFVYNPRISTSAPVGPISRNKLGRGIMSPLYSVFRFKSENIDYLEHFFSTTLWHKYLKQVANYGARFDRMAISTEDFYAMPIFVPSLPEQQKIAECLSSVDNLIQAEADQLQALKDHKKGLMQQLFPQEGETTPKLRFPGFEGEWEEKKLGEVGETVSGLTYSPSNVSNDGSGLLVLRSSNIKNGMLCFDDNVYVQSIKKYNPVKENDILICVRNGSSSLIGKNALIPIGLSAAFGAFMMVFRTNQWSFVFQLLQTETYSKQIEQNLGARINSINSEDFKNYEFFFPSTPEEQQKIAECLSSLDEGIAAQQEKVEALKEHKKGLMQKLFPTIN